MFTRKTLFIIGAGASAEFGLPTGYELKTRVATAINYHGSSRGQDGELASLLQQKFTDHMEYIRMWVDWTCNISELAKCWLRCVFRLRRS